MHRIKIQGARTHNLKNIDLTLPRDQLIVITGLSGSGKSSLAFDTLYAEGQRRYVESLSAYARQFLSVMEKPDVDHIEGLSPAISIQQKSTSHNPRSTVGTITEIYDYLRLLYARVGTPQCPTHGTPLVAQTISQMVDSVLALPLGTKVMILASVINERKGEQRELFAQLKAQGFVRARIDGHLVDLEAMPLLDAKKKHTIDVVVDRLSVKLEAKLRLSESFEIALRLGSDIAKVSLMDDPVTPDVIFSQKFACHLCNYSLAELEPRLFSFNNPAGACSGCDGLGSKHYFDPAKVIAKPDCSLADGAIRGWDQACPYYFGLLSQVAAHYGVDINKPFEKLPEKIKKILLYGSGTELIDFEFLGERRQRIMRQQAFEGIMTNLQRRYLGTESTLMRDEFKRLMTEQVCPECHGGRLNTAASHVFIEGKNLSALTHISIQTTHDWLAKVKLKGHLAPIAAKINKEILARLQFLINVGLAYLSLDRSADTLSGGEAQRIRLASQIGAGLMGVLYILDEPSIGLHQRDNEKLLKTLLHLKNLGNTVIVVEHDSDTISHADYVVDMGPGAGIHGGHVVVAGTPEQVKACPKSITGQYLSGVKGISIPKQRIPFDPKQVLSIINASGNNLQHISVEIPLGLMTCITGVSGSGKSTLINDTLYPIVANVLNGACERTAAPYQAILGLELLDKVIDIDQSPIGRTPRSNPATYTGIFTPIRELFAQTPEARSRGYTPGRFSFNVKGGRCEACEGDGLIKVEMHFLADMYVTCDQCHGKRYNRETLEVHYKGKNIHDVLLMTIEEALVFFQAIPVIARKCQTLVDVGLTYIALGQSATTLSGGEAQRIKLAKELSKRDTGKTLYLLDEPTTGLHFADIAQLLLVLQRLRDLGNTLVIIEHNLDVIKTADWVIDLGPEGGSGGGQILCVGTPEQVVKCKKSHTARFLKPLLK